MLIEENVTINSNVTLKGTLTLPESTEKVPAVLFIHGSGPTDRNENVKFLKINTFKELADQLTPIGFATLRYDKRGIGESGGSYLEAGFWDLVDDAEAAVNFLKQHDRIDPDRIILLGHSEGCIIAPALNQRLTVNGLILLAGAAESLKEVVYRQSELAFKELDEMKGFKGWLFRLLKVSEKGRKSQEKAFKKILDTTDNVTKVQFKKINAKWMREHFAYNVSMDLEYVTCPTLAITGEKDIQVLPEDAKKITELVKGPAEYYIIKDLNHLLRKQGEAAAITGIKKAYKESVKKPLDKELVARITTWLHNNFQS